MRRLPEGSRANLKLEEVSYVAEKGPCRAEWFLDETNQKSWEDAIRPGLVGVEDQKVKGGAPRSGIRAITGGGYADISVETFALLLVRPVAEHNLETRSPGNLRPSRGRDRR